MKTPQDPGRDPQRADAHLSYLLTAYLFGDISAGGQAEVETHLAACPECRGELQALRATQALVASSLVPQIAAGDAPPVEYAFEERRRARVLAHALRSRGRAPWLRRSTALAAALLLVVCLVALSIPTVFHRAGAPAPGRRAEYGQVGGDTARSEFEDAQRLGRSSSSMGIPLSRGPGAGAVADGIRYGEFDRGYQNLGEATPTNRSSSASRSVSGKPQASARPRSAVRPAATPQEAVLGVMAEETAGRHAGLRDRVEVLDAMSAPSTPAESRKDLAADLRSGVRDGSVRSLMAQRDAKELEDPALITRSNDGALVVGGTDERHFKSLESAAILDPAQPDASFDSSTGPRFKFGTNYNAHARVARNDALAQLPPADRPPVIAGSLAERDRAAGARTEDNLGLGLAEGKAKGPPPTGVSRNPEVWNQRREQSPEQKLALSKATGALDDGTGRRILERAGEAPGSETPSEIASQRFQPFAPAQSPAPQATTGVKKESAPTARFTDKSATAKDASESDYFLRDQDRGEALEYRPPAVDPIPVGALERSLRAFAHYRSRIPDLTWSDFSARPVSVPAPAVGDEGLGDEPFRARYGVHPFVDTRKDALSTFALDVDTASYSRARALLLENRLPAPTEVRVEEFVNSFPSSEVADPTRDFSVFCEGGPAPFGAAGVELLAVTVKARDLAAAERRPVVLTFAIDSSGSMLLEDRLDAVRGALGTLVDGLQPDDQVAVVAYADQPVLLLPHTAARERARILAALAALTSRGGTNVEAGLDLAYRLADEAWSPRSQHRVVLCSDGVATSGARSAEAMLAKVQSYARRGIDLSVIGFGRQRYDDGFLETLANKGNGQYAFVDSQDEAERLFRAQLPAALHVLARDAKIQVEFDPATVAHYRLLGYENRDLRDVDFRNDAVDAGEVGPGTTVTALYEIVRRPASHGALGRVFLRYRSAATLRVEELDFPLPAGVRQTDLATTSDRFRLLAAVAEFAELLRQSYWAQDGSFGEVARLLATLSDEGRAHPEVIELVSLVHHAQVRTVLDLTAVVTQDHAEKDKP